MSLPHLPHSWVGPVPIFSGSRHEVIRFCLDAIETRSGAWVATANLDYVARARRDHTLRSFLRETSIVIADGAPVAWLARLSGAHRTERVAGADLVGHLLEHSRSPLRLVLYGSTPAIAEAAAQRLRDTYPRAQVVAVVCPPFSELSPAEQDGERDLLRRLDPDVVLVALGCPKQESLIARYRDACPSAVWIGVGGTFDFFAGHRRRAPSLVQRLGGEWLVRLAQEPRRLWRRYFLEDVPALLAVAPGCLGARFRGGAVPPATE